MATSHSSTRALIRTTPGGRAFCRGLTAARPFRLHEGHIAVPYSHTEMLFGQPMRLGRWLYRQRKNYAQLTPGHAEALTALGVKLPPVFQAPDITAFSEAAAGAWREGPFGTVGTIPRPPVVDPFAVDPLSGSVAGTRT